MSFYADLHIHSKYSRATSRDCDLEHLAQWAAIKGIAVLGTGDFTHPAWFEEIKQNLVPAEPGLFRLRPELEREVDARLPPCLRSPVRLLLTVEVSTIYKRGDRTRKVHHVVFAPDLECADRIRARLHRIGNIASDGRPILGLDSRDLLEITLEAGDEAYLAPAHVWTPWFSVLGSKSGFDSIEECYGDLACHIFALETGLSSDPPMNWRLSSLDRYTLISNSDAHSPAKLGREANLFDTELDYFEMKRALETGHGYLGTVEFFPEEGKYHLDGHRKCGVCMAPAETIDNEGLCPVCQKPVTVGVLNRVEELADRREGVRPEGAAGFKSFIPLVEIISEIMGKGDKTKGVTDFYRNLVDRLGPELFILEHAPLEDVKKHGGTELSEALMRMRQGRVIKTGGYDGEYGAIRLFEKGELKRAGGVLFELEKDEIEPAAEEKAGSFQQAKRTRKKPGIGADRPRTGKEGRKPKSSNEPEDAILQGLDPEQRKAATNIEGALLITAGPGAGKTGTLTRRMAYMVAAGRRTPEECLALTFTRKAAEEMKTRLTELMPGAGEKITVTTFHGLGRMILAENAHRLGLPGNFRVVAEAERLDIVMSAAGVKKRKAKSLLSSLSVHKRKGTVPEPYTELGRAYAAYHHEMKSRALLDFDDLIGLAVELLDTEPDVLAKVRERWTAVSVDELQDLDPLQYRMLKLLCPPGSNICAIGDPDQAIYGFRGADASLFSRFTEDWPGAVEVNLARNYRSIKSIVEGAGQVIRGHSLSGDRVFQSAEGEGARIVIHRSSTDRAEAEFIAHTIEELMGGHGFFSMDSGRTDGAGGDYAFSDFAVLARVESVFDHIFKALSRLGLPCLRRSHVRLTERPEAAMLLEELSKAAGEKEDVTKLVARASESVACKSGKGGGLEEVLEMLAPLARKCGPDLPRFLTEAELLIESDTLDPRADRISLLTMHAAKGLEFRVVFVAGCEDGLVPLKWGGRCENPEEERRLFFVAMTRARERLFISYADRRMRSGKVGNFSPSPYLAALSEDMLERSRQKPGGRRKARADTQLDLF